MNRQCVVFVALFILLCDASPFSLTKFTNLKCATSNPSFMNFTICKLRVIKRGVIGANVYIELYKPPLTNIQANLGLYKKASGYKPFLYNISVEYCNFARHPKSNLMLGLVMNILKEYSNLNHTCPYDHDVIVRDLILPEEKFRLIPLPSGEYLLKFLLHMGESLTLTIDAFFSREE